MNRAFVKSVLREHARRHLPGPPDLWPAIQARIVATERPQLVARPLGTQPGRGRVPWGKTLLVGGLMGSILLAVVLGVLRVPGGVTEPLAASAAEVLARADAAAQPGGPIHSTHMTLTIRSRGNFLDPFTEGQSEWWNEAPNKSRTLSTYRAADGTTPYILLGSDGTTSFLYDDTTHEFNLYSISQWDMSASSDLESVTKFATRIAGMNIYDAVLSGTETIGGRPAYVLDFTVKPGIQATSSTFQPFQLRKKLWIDQQTYLVLREQDWAANDTLVREMQYQHLDVNPTLDPALFAPTPPANAIVADMRPATPADIAAGWREIAGRLTVPLFEATKYPDWMVPGRPYYAPSGVVSQTFSQAAERHSGPSMIISQGSPGTAMLNAPDWGAGQPVQIGPLTGRIYSKRLEFILIFAREGTRIRIYMTPNIGSARSQLIQAAQSLQPVPR